MVRAYGAAGLSHGRTTCIILLHINAYDYQPVVRHQPAILILIRNKIANALPQEHGLRVSLFTFEIVAWYNG